MKLNRLLDVLVWAALAAAVVLFVRRRSSGPSEGALAEPIDVPLLDGTGRFELARERGKPVVMEVFASWCGTCRRATPVLAEAYERHSPDQVTFVGVSVDETREAARQARADWGIPYPVALDDGDIARGYGVSLLPTVVLIDREGKVRRSIAGVPSRDEIDRFIASR